MFENIPADRCRNFARTASVVCILLERFPKKKGHHRNGGFSKSSSIRFANFALPRFLQAKTFSGPLPRSHLAEDDTLFSPTRTTTNSVSKCTRLKSIKQLDRDPPVTLPPPPFLPPPPPRQAAWMMVNERRTEAVAFAFIAWRRPYQFCPLLRMQGLEEVPPLRCPPSDPHRCHRPTKAPSPINHVRRHPTRGRSGVSSGSRPAAGWELVGSLFPSNKIFFSHIDPLFTKGFHKGSIGGFADEMGREAGGSQQPERQPAAPEPAQPPPLSGRIRFIGKLAFDFFWKDIFFAPILFLPLS